MCFEDEKKITCCFTGHRPEKLPWGSDESSPDCGLLKERLAQTLEGLYRRTAQAVRPPAQNLPVEQAGRTRLDEKPERAAALTVDELDWAVRRDSRRYDGGMTIY